MYNYYTIFLIININYRYGHKQIKLLDMPGFTYANFSQIIHNN